MSSRAPTGFLVCLAALVLGGCAAAPAARPADPAPPPVVAAPPPPAPPQIVVKEREPTNLDVARDERAIALDDVFIFGVLSFPDAPATAATTPRVPAPKAAPNKAEATESPCARVCAALASMKRTTDHLCGLTGDADEHCTSARTRTARAAESVAKSCPTCP